MLNFMTCAIFSLPFRIHLRDLLSGSVCCCWSEQIWWPFYMCGIVMNKWPSPIHPKVTILEAFFHFYHKIVRIFWYFVYIRVSSWPNINKIQNILFSGLCSACSVMQCSVQLFSPSPTLNSNYSRYYLFTWPINVSSVGHVINQLRILNFKKT